MKKIAVIPARYAASRFPAKMMAILGNKTVIRTTYENTVKTNLFDDVFVVTDSNIILEEITSHGGKAIMSISEHETGSDRIAEAVQNIDCEIIINVQGDEPFIERDSLEKMLYEFENDAKKEIDLISVMQEFSDAEEVKNPNRVKVIVDNQNFALYFSRAPIPFHRADDFTAKYYEHKGIYGFRKDSLLKFAKLPMLQNEKAEKIECIRYLEYGMKIKMVVSNFKGIGIDTPEDLIKANQWIHPNP